MNNAACKLTPIIGNSDFTKNIVNILNTVSGSSASVLLIGEKGTGKKLFAQHIHHNFVSNQNNLSNVKSNFFEVNCKTFKSSDVQMILDGIGKFFPKGSKISLFLNNVDYLSDELQNDLLKAIKSAKENSLELKVICSTEKNLEEQIENGKFSNDLFYQINAIVLNLLPLRFRRDDIIPLAEYYRELFVKQSGINMKEYSDDAKKLLLEQYWPGNIDELINSIQRAFIVGEEPVIKTADLGLVSKETDASAYISDEDCSLKTAVDSFKREYIRKILEKNNWNQTKTAKILGIQRTYVIKLINDLNIKR